MESRAQHKSHRHCLAHLRRCELRWCRRFLSSCPTTEQSSAAAARVCFVSQVHQCPIAVQDCQLLEKNKTTCDIHNRKPHVRNCAQCNKHVLHSQLTRDENYDFKISTMKLTLNKQLAQLHSYFKIITQKQLSTSTISLLKTSLPKN